MVIFVQGIHWHLFANLIQNLNSISFEFGILSLFDFSVVYFPLVTSEMPR